MKTRQLPPAPAADSTAPGAGLRRYLYVTAGITGAAIMIVEILGAKMLSPFVGTSHFVWTAQIAVTLVALACGYYAGGRLADRAARLGVLYWAILAAAGYLALTVALRERVVYGFLGLPLPAASLIVSAILFFPPLVLLAMTGPFLVRVVAPSFSVVGGTVGKLTSIGTVGSFLGTVAIGYVLIPLLPNSVTMYGTAALLAVVSGTYFLGWGRRLRAAVAAAVLAAIVAVGAWASGSEGPRIASMKELYRGNSNFGLLQVLQSVNGPSRYYFDDYLIQNTYDAATGRSISMFTYMLEGLARSYAPRLRKVLCIGMGVGIVPRDLARKGASVDVVEINPAVVPVAERYFDLDPAVFHLVIGDGRYFVNQSTDRYDAVILDAFLGGSSPSHLMSREAFTAMARIMEPDGVLVINTFAELGSTKDFMAASLYRTLTAVFPSVVVHGARNSNSLYVASPRAGLRILNPPEFADVHPDALAEVREAFGRTWQPEAGAGIVLTDDYNPVDYYDAAHREKLRRALALMMQGAPGG